MLAMADIEFKDWLRRRLGQYESDVDHEISKTKFAKMLGVSQPTLSQWLAGNTLPKDENIPKIAALLGDDVYDVLKRIRPNQSTSEWQKLWDMTPASERSTLLEINKKWLHDKGFDEYKATKKDE